MDLQLAEADLRDVLVQALGALPRKEFQGEYRARAAVLMALGIREREPSFLLTKRTQTVSTHKGEISFPGGLHEEQDVTLEETALRETREELGISSERIEIVGSLNDYLAVTYSRVRPYAALLTGSPKLVPNPCEVARVLWIPLRYFLETEPRVEYWERLGRRVAVHFYEYENETVWGLTARMIYDFLQVLTPALTRVPSGTDSLDGKIR